MNNTPIMTSMKNSRIDRDPEDSSMPMLREMTDDALRAFASYERQKGGVSIATQTARATINGRPVIGLVVVAVYPTDKLETAVAEAIKQTIEHLP